MPCQILLIFLNTLIKEKLPNCIVTLSGPVMRSDNPKENLTIQHLNRYLKGLDMNVFDNANIRDIHLGRKDLHLNERGVKQLAANIIYHLQRF